MPPKTPTATYYSTHAQTYFESTHALDCSALHRQFLRFCVHPHLPILDGGCGSGRDALAFKKHGHIVHAFDQSPELAALATTLLQQPVDIATFDTAQPHPLYQGLWFNASLLHLTFSEVRQTLQRWLPHLISKGPLFASFKLGDQTNRIESGTHRQFCDLNERTVLELLTNLPVEPTFFISQDVSRPDTQWLNIHALKI